MVNQIEAEKLCIVCTGSQGEQLAALSRIANNTHKYVHIIPGDTVLLSSNPIPGNALNVSGNPISNIEVISHIEYINE